MSKESPIIYNLNDFRYSDDNLTAFFKRIKFHNALFPECSYKLVGFVENNDGKICAVLEQNFILKDRPATEEEITKALELKGFLPQMG